MGLKDLKSNLAAGEFANSSAEDLTYGKGRAYDRPDQGFSQEPFIKKRLNLGGDTGFNSITGGFIRGGILKHADNVLISTRKDFANFEVIKNELLREDF